jgi:hypothetical protein
LNNNLFILSDGEKKALLMTVLNEAYCCYRKYRITEIVAEEYSSKPNISKLKSSMGEMKKHIGLAKKLAKDLNVTCIDWNDPHSFVKYLF